MSNHEAWSQPNIETPKREPSDIEYIQECESKISPEQIEQIMTKVQDINQKGIAFSLIRSDKFENVLDEGVLGSYESPMNAMSAEINKETWAVRTRAEKQSNVYFNITGRQLGRYLRREGAKSPIGNSRWVAETALAQDKIVILFDISKFKEDLPIFDRRHESAKFNVKTYRAIGSPHFTPDEHDSDDMMKMDYHSKKYQEMMSRVVEGNVPRDNEMLEAGKTFVEDEDGFVLSHRVAPKLFQGIVVKFIPDDVWEKRNEKGNFSINASVEFDTLDFRTRLAPYLKMFLNKNICNPDKLIPVYDTFGNLCWPKRMKYEEVKQFIKEREAKNINKEEK